jgi:PHD/YefM family antitoxin component YafN of YafNO toxin-antitoxin module
MTAPASNRLRPSVQPVATGCTITNPADSSFLDAAISPALAHKPSSALKKEGWSGFMREVNTHGMLVVTHYNKPQAVVLSVDRYQALERLAQLEKMREAQQVAELRARFDKRLASLNAPQAREALNAFMDESGAGDDPGSMEEWPDWPSA